MKGKRFTKQEIDEITRRLVRDAGPGTDEIERIVSAPGLFEGVIGRIAALDVPTSSPQRVFPWKPALASAFGAVIVTAIMFAAMASGPEPAANATVRARPLPNAYTVDEKPMPPAAGISPAEDPRPARQHAVKAVYSEPIETDKRRISRRQVSPAEPAGPPEPVFHTISFPEKAEDAAIDGRVVEVELPRAALYAMGVDLPLENGTRRVKAELLVGADGSPRAIRLVE